MALIKLTANQLTANQDNWLGTAGNDIIDALGGNDTLDGGAGNDSLTGNLGNDLMAGGAGNDTLNGGDGDDMLDGGADNDLLSGDKGNDFIHAGAGLDILNGGVGDDYLFGGAGNDKLFGGAGSDFLEGGDGDDILADTNDLKTYGIDGTEQDEMSGGSGNDTFYGGYDVMSGDEGNDVFYINNQATAYGGIGDDKITVTIPAANTSAIPGSWLDGGLGADSIVAGAGNDTLISGYGQDTLVGGAGDDSYVITFDNMADTIIDTAGIDTVYYIRDVALDGRDDDFDAVSGKELDPVVSVSAYNVTLAAGIENGVLDDEIYVSNPASVSYTAWLTGNELNNKLQGSNLNDILYGGAGDDTINAGAGNDILDGGTGNDTIDGGAGNDTIDGGAGDDTINAGAGNDTIFSGVGTDVIDGGAGRDLVAASVSVDLITFKGVEDIDLLDFDTALVATGNSSNNLLLGNKYNNTLIGGEGNDTLDGMYYSPTYAPTTTSTSGDDTLIGGKGNDLYRIDSANDIITEVSATTGGVDTVEFKGAVATLAYTLTDGVENLVIKGNLKEVDGNHLNNKIIGDSAANILKGGYGDDFLDGGSGIDSLEGGYGDDTFVVDNINDAILEFNGQGNDWVQSANINVELRWGSVENARLTGTASLTVTGNDNNNRLVGNDGNNILDSRGLNDVDTLEGGLGNDTYKVNSRDDALIEVDNLLDASGKINQTVSIDTVQTSVDFSLASLLNFENLSLDGSATTGTGNLNDNVLFGNDVANILDGGAGNDTLNGFAGEDTLIGGAGNDTYRLSNDGDMVAEQANEGIDTIETQYTFSLSDLAVSSKTTLASLANIENITLGGTNAIDGTGNITDNLITGNLKANILMGLDGNDTLKGLDGEDLLIGGKGADVLDLTESVQSKDVVRIALGDSLATASDADKVIKFAQLYDMLDLTNTFKIGTAPVNDVNSGSIKSMHITNGIAQFDDLDSYSVALTIGTSNLNDTIGYLSKNITDGSTVAFQAGSDTWVFQDNGTASDTLVDLVGVVSITGLSGTAGGAATLWIQ